MSMLNICDNGKIYLYIIKITKTNNCYIFLDMLLTGCQSSAEVEVHVLLFFYG